MLSSSTNWAKIEFHMGINKVAPERPLAAKTQISNRGAWRGGDPADPVVRPREGRPICPESDVVHTCPTLDREKRGGSHDDANPGENHAKPTLARHCRRRRVSRRNRRRLSGR